MKRTTKIIMQTHYVDLKRFCKAENENQDWRAEEPNSRLHFVIDFYECPYHLLVFAYVSIRSAIVIRFGIFSFHVLKQQKLSIDYA